MRSNDEHAKLLFQIEGTSPNEYDVESLWVIEVDGGYVIDNIPFYAMEVAHGDTVKARVDEDGALWFDGLVKASGHSTIRLWFAREEDVQPTRESLLALGLGTEVSDRSRLVAVDVPPEVRYETVKAVFDDGEAKGVFEYEEACLGFSANPGAEGGNP